MLEPRCTILLEGNVAGTLMLILVFGPPLELSELETKFVSHLSPPLSLFQYFIFRKIFYSDDNICLADEKCKENQIHAPLKYTDFMPCMYRECLLFGFNEFKSIKIVSFFQENSCIFMDSIENYQSLEL